MPGATDTTLPIRGEHFRSTDQESCLTSFGPASAAVDRTATRRSCRGLLGSPRFCRVGQARAGAAEASRSSATPPQTGGPPRSCGCSVQVSCRYLPHGSSSTTQSHRQVLRKYSRTYPAGAAPALTYTGSRWSRPLSCVHRRRDTAASPVFVSPHCFSPSPEPAARAIAFGQASSPWHERRFCRRRHRAANLGRKSLLPMAADLDATASGGQLEAGSTWLSIVLARHQLAHKLLSLHVRAAATRWLSKIAAFPYGNVHFCEQTSGGYPC